MPRGKFRCWQLAPLQLLESTINTQLPVIDEEEDNTNGLIKLTREDESSVNADDPSVSHLLVNLV